VTKKRRAAPRPRSGDPRSNAGPGEGSHPPGTPPARSRPPTSSGRGPGPAPSRRVGQTALLVGGAVVVAALTLAAVVLGQGTGKTGLDSFRSPTLPPLAVASPGAASGASGASGGPIATIDASGIATIGGIACDPNEQVSYHVHSHLIIRVDGTLETIPGDVGRYSTCLFWLHTHATSGIIHIEAPSERTFTLGQFFDVWGKPLDGTHVADWTAPAGSKVWVFVDGKQQDVDPRSIELKDIESIELQVGPSPIEPIVYTWPPEYLPEGASPSG